ncbi:TetR/AcrR family transcriptional regulator [Aquipuribacter nitratireducens]|uniref:TetR/AcrR family transcriptional regulator n=1 Tax=Aquipuribacter nitratireducens TaxID=650104 RepID=A0ABW0GI85_9MICO
MRSDAVRNRTRVLETARRLVARDGAAVRMDDVATEAGVAVGTLYRHFGTKEALVAAVVEDSVVAIADRAEASAAALEAGAPAWEVVEDLVQQVARSYQADKAVKAAAALLRPDGAGGETLTAATRRAEAAVGRVLALAQDAGALRPDVTTEDLAVVLAQVPDDPTGRAQERYLRVVLRGLRPD